jgi:hypothetical protein
MRTTKKTRALAAMMDQLKWVADHGNDLAGYMARYGSKLDPDHYGNGGEAIYAADMAELRKCQAAYFHARRGA